MRIDLALNSVSVDFKFVLKTKMMQRPIQVLLSFATIYIIAVSWLFALCERDRYACVRRPPLVRPFVTNLRTTVSNLS